MRRIVVDDVEYHWRHDRDWDYQSPPHVLVVRGGRERGKPGDGPPRRIKFFIKIPRDRDTEPGWWAERRAPAVTPRIVERAIRLAARDPAVYVQLSERDVAEIFVDPDPPRTEHRLRDLERVLAVVPVVRHDVVRALLALGCHDDGGELVDDWLICHGAALDIAHETLDAPEPHMRRARELRSAIAFLANRCARVGIDLAIDTTELDRWLAENPGAGRPWGIPIDHIWW